MSHTHIYKPTSSNLPVFYDNIRSITKGLAPATASTIALTVFLMRLKIIKYQVTTASIDEFTERFK